MQKWITRKPHPLSAYVWATMSFCPCGRRRAHHAPTSSDPHLRLPTAESTERERERRDAPERLLPRRQLQRGGRSLHRGAASASARSGRPTLCLRLSEYSPLSHAASVDALPFCTLILAEALCADHSLRALSTDNALTLGTLPVRSDVALCCVDQMLCAIAALEDVAPAPVSDVFYGK